MDLLTFISSLVQYGAWPLAVGIVACLLTRHGRQIARHIEGVTLPKGIAIKFRDGSDVQQTQTTNIVETAIRNRKKVPK